MLTNKRLEDLINESHALCTQANTIDRTAELSCTEKIARFNEIITGLQRILTELNEGDKAPDLQTIPHKTYLFITYKYICLVILFKEKYKKKLFTENRIKCSTPEELATLITEHRGQLYCDHDDITRYMSKKCIPILVDFAGDPDIGLLRYDFFYIMTLTLLDLMEINLIERADNEELLKRLHEHFVDYVPLARKFGKHDMLQIMYYRTIQFLPPTLLQNLEIQEQRLTIFGQAQLIRYTDPAANLQVYYLSWKLPCCRQRMFFPLNSIPATILQQLFTLVEARNLMSRISNDYLTIDLLLGVIQVLYVVIKNIEILNKCEINELGYLIYLRAYVQILETANVQTFIDKCENAHLQIQMSAILLYAFCIRLTAGDARPNANDLAQARLLSGKIKHLQKEHQDTLIDLADPNVITTTNLLIESQTMCAKLIALVSAAPPVSFPISEPIRQLPDQPTIDWSAVYGAELTLGHMINIARQMLQNKQMRELTGDFLKNFTVLYQALDNCSFLQRSDIIYLKDQKEKLGKALLRQRNRPPLQIGDMCIALRPKLMQILTQFAIFVEKYLPVNDICSEESQQNMSNRLYQLMLLCNTTRDYTSDVVGARATKIVQPPSVLQISRRSFLELCGRISPETALDQNCLCCITDLFNLFDLAFWLENIRLADESFPQYHGKQYSDLRMLMFDYIEKGRSLIEFWQSQKVMLCILDIFNGAITMCGQIPNISSSVAPHAPALTLQRTEVKRLMKPPPQPRVKSDVSRSKKTDSEASKREQKRQKRIREEKRILQSWFQRIAEANRLRSEKERKELAQMNREEEKKRQILEQEKAAEAERRAAIREEQKIREWQKGAETRAAKGRRRRKRKQLGKNPRKSEGAGDSGEEKEKKSDAEEKPQAENHKHDLIAELRASLDHRKSMTPITEKYHKGISEKGWWDAVWDTFISWQIDLERTDARQKVTVEQVLSFLRSDDNFNEESEFCKLWVNHFQHRRNILQEICSPETVGPSMGVSLVHQIKKCHVPEAEDSSWQTSQSTVLDLLNSRWKIFWTICKAQMQTPEKTQAQKEVGTTLRQYPELSNVLQFPSELITPTMNVGLTIIRGLCSLGYLAVLHGGVLLSAIYPTSANKILVYDIDILVVDIELAILQGYMLRQHNYTLSGKPRDIGNSSDKLNCRFRQEGQLIVDITIYSPLNKRLASWPIFDDYTGLDCDAIFMTKDQELLPPEFVKRFRDGKIQALPDIVAVAEKNPSAIFRSVRLKTVYGIQLQEEDSEYIRDHSLEIVKKMKPYEIYSEMCKCLTRKDQIAYLSNLDEFGLLRHINYAFHTILKNKDGLLDFIREQFNAINAQEAYPYHDTHNHAVALFLLPKSLDGQPQDTDIVENFLCISGYRGKERAKGRVVSLIAVYRERYEVYNRDPSRFSHDLPPIPECSVESVVTWCEHGLFGQTPTGGPLATLEHRESAQYTPSR